MKELIAQLLKSLEIKTSWGIKELRPKLEELSIKANTLDVGKTIPLIKTVEVIKKYDILFLPLLGIPHFFLVHRIKDDLVYGVGFSSKEKQYSLHKIEKDRFFIGTFATESYLTCSLEDAKKAFCRRFESREEAEIIFKKVKQHYKTILNL